MRVAPSATSVVEVDHAQTSPIAASPRGQQVVWSRKRGPRNALRPRLSWRMSLRLCPCPSQGGFLFAEFLSSWTEGLAYLPAVRYWAKHCVFVSTSGSYITCRVAPPRFARMSAYERVCRASRALSRALINQVSALTLD